LPPGYHYELKNGFHNYHFTPANFKLPPLKTAPPSLTILEGFAPNLNKKLHIGHLKNLAIANALARILHPCKPVAMLGASLGILPGALEELQEWFNFVGYQPSVLLDSQLPHGVVPTSAGTGKFAGCLIYEGPLGPVVVVKASGQPTYAYHDLAYAQIVKPDLYITGSEQKEHFAALGLADKHLPMGLVLGADGKKMSSSTGEAPLATEAFALVLAKLDATPEPKKLAWNILAYTFLLSSVSSNTKFDPVQMTNAQAPGMYVTYTLARTYSALAKANVVFDNDKPPPQLTDCDVELLGKAAYAEYYEQKAVQANDPAPLATYLLTLAKHIAKVYAKQSIKAGSAGYQFAVSQAFCALKNGMVKLGLFPLHEV